MSAAELSKVATKNRILRVFKRAHAVSPYMTINPSEYSIAKGKIFNRLVKQRILIQTSSERYYLDIDREIKLKKSSNKAVIVAMMIIILTVFVIFVVFYLSR